MSLAKQFRCHLGCQNLFWKIFVRVLAAPGCSVLLFACMMADNRLWIVEQSPCQLCGRPGLSSWLLALAWPAPTPAIVETDAVNQQMAVCFLLLSPFCLVVSAFHAINID